MLAALGPMLVCGGLDLLDIRLADRSVSNSKRQHNCPIAEKSRGRQHKMHGSEKKIVVGIWPEKLAKMG